MKLAFALAFAWVMVGAPAGAVMFSPGYSPRVLRQQSQYIVRARVESEAVGEVETIVHATVLGRVKGALHHGARIELSIPGGTTLFLNGGAYFEPGETYRLYLRRNRRGQLTTVNLGGGVQPLHHRGRLAPAYTFLTTPPSRWFSPPTFQFAGPLDATLGSTSAFAALAAILAWNNNSSVGSVLNSGTPASVVAGPPCDGVNRILFNDVLDLLDAPIGCGGAVGVGGFCGGTGSGGYNSITSAFALLNSGFGACSFWTGTNISEILTHEVGHALGMGHSADTQAIMYAFAHVDGRGAALNADDIAGIQVLYPLPSTTTTTASTSTSTSHSTSTVTSTSVSTTATICDCHPA